MHLPTRRTVPTAAVALGFAAVVAPVLALGGCGDDADEPGRGGRPASDLVEPINGVRITWDADGGTPACRYDAATRSVVARLRMDGTATRDTTLAVTVSAYADENTSELLNAVTQLAYADQGPVQEEITVTIPVERPSHRGEDGGTACTLDVDDET